MAFIISCLLIIISILAVIHVNKKRYTSNDTEYIARINTSYFSSLKEAVEAAENNDTIYILKDFDLNDKIDFMLDITLESESGCKTLTIKRGNEFDPYLNGFFRHSNMFYINGGNLTINNLIIDGGAVWNEEGLNIGIAADFPMIYLYYGTLTLNEAVLQNNDNNTELPADNCAGAIGVDIEAVLTVNNSSICYNRTKGDGGAISNEGGKIYIINSKINNNTAGYGGAVSMWNNSLHIKNSEILNNTATYFSGGAICAKDSDVIIENSRLLGNMADINGGAIDIYYGALSIHDSIINYNTAIFDGSAIYAYNHGEFETDVVIQNTEIRGNYCEEGTSIYYMLNGKLILSGNVIITENRDSNIRFIDSNNPIVLNNQFSTSTCIGIDVIFGFSSIGDIIVDGSRLQGGASLEHFYCEDSFYVLEKDGPNLILGLSQKKHGAGTDDEYYLCFADTYNTSKDRGTFNQYKNNILARTASINKLITLKNEDRNLFQVKKKDVKEIHNRNNQEVNQAEAVPKEYSGIQIVKRAMIVIGTCFLLVTILYVKTRNDPINR